MSIAEVGMHLSFLHKIDVKSILGNDIDFFILHNRDHHEYNVPQKWTYKEASLEYELIKNSATEESYLLVKWTPNGILEPKETVNLLKITSGGIKAECGNNLQSCLELMNSEIQYQDNPSSQSTITSRVLKIAQNLNAPTKGNLFPQFHTKNGEGAFEMLTVEQYVTALTERCDLLRLGSDNEVKVEGIETLASSDLGYNNPLNNKSEILIN